MRARLGLRGAISCLCAALLVPACAPDHDRPAAPESYVPQPPKSPFRLPALTDDGLHHPAEPLVPSLVPRVLQGPAEDRSPDDPWEPWPKGARTAPGAWVFPDTAALLAGLSLETEEEDGVLSFRGKDADLAGRALAALDGATNRRYRVEVRAVRTWPGRTPPTPDAVLAEDSARTLVRFDATIRDGALAVAAPREDATFPADVDVDHVAIRPIALRFGVGAVLGVSPARVDGRRALLRLGFHAARLLGERRISGEDVDRDAPLLASISFAGEVPAADGVASSVVADSGDPETSFVLAWRVSLAREPARTAGALAYSLHADRPLVQRIAPPRGGPIELPEETIDLEEFDEWRAPAPVPPGLRAAIVEPGWCVLTGDDAALRAYADGAEASRAARLAPATFRSGRTRLPLVPSRGAVLVQGRVVPFAEIAEIDIAQESAGAAFRTGWSFHGRTLEILPAGGDGDGGGGDDGGGVLARVRNSPPPEIERGAARLPRSDSDGERTSRDVLDRLRLREDATQVVLRPGDASTASGLSLETATW